MADSDSDSRPDAVPIPPPLVPGPGASFGQRARYWCYKYVGTLLMTRGNHGDTVMSLERTAFIVMLCIAASTWSEEKEIPSTFASFLNLLVGAVFGQNALSTVGFLARQKLVPKGEPPVA